MVSNLQNYEQIDNAVSIRISKRIIQHDNAISKQKALLKNVFRSVCKSRLIFYDIFMFISVLGYFFLDIPGHGLGEYPGSLDDKVIVLYRVRKYFFSKMVITIGLGTSYVTWHAFSREISTQKTLTFTKKRQYNGS